MVNPNRRSHRPHRSCRPRLNRLVEAARAKATSYQAWAMAARLVTVQALGGGAEPAMVQHVLAVARDGVLLAAVRDDVMVPHATRRG
jgi:hypothetical protein